MQVKELTSSAAQCPGDHVSLYDGVDEYSELIGRWCGVGSFPVSIIGSSNKLFLEFVSTKHGPLLNTGQLLVASSRGFNFRWWNDQNLSSKTSEKQTGLFDFPTGEMCQVSTSA